MLKYKNLLIFMLLEKIMLKFVSRFHDRLAQAVRWKTKVTPCVRKLLDKSVEKSRNMRMISRSSNEYQVFEGQTRFCIVLKEKKMVLCMHHKRIEMEDLCHVYYIVKTFRKTYNEIVHLLPKVDIDPKKNDVIVLPPNFKRSVRRPEKNRQIEQGEDQPRTINKKSFHT